MKSAACRSNTLSIIISFEPDHHWQVLDLKQGLLLLGRFLSRENARSVMSPSCGEFLAGFAIPLEV